MRTIRSLARLARSSAIQLLGSLETSGKISQLPLINPAVDFQMVAELSRLPNSPSLAVIRAFSSNAPPEMPGLPKEITTPQEFSDLIAFSSQVPIILDAYATWCGPCKQLDPVLKQLIDSHGGRVALAKLDIDVPTLAPLVQQLQINSVPTLFLIFGGRIIDVKMGVSPQAELREWINKAVELAKAVAGAVKGEAPGKGESATANPWDTLREAYVTLLSMQRFGPVLQYE